MPEKSWKKFERDIAKAFGTSRALMKGTDEKNDIDSDMFCVDAKLRKRWEIDRWFKELKEYALETDGKIPILIVRKPKTHQRLAIVELDFLIAALKGAGLLEGEEV